MIKRPRNFGFGAFLWSNAGSGSGSELWVVLKVQGLWFKV